MSSWESFEESTRFGTGSAHVVAGTGLHGCYCKEVTSSIHSYKPELGKGRAAMDGGPHGRGTFVGTQLGYFSRSWEASRKDSLP